MIKAAIYIILSVWGVFTTYILFEAFYDGRNVKPKVKWTIFTLYLVIINLAYLKINIPIITLLSNILMFLLISYVYKANIKKSIISVTLIYVIALSGESLSAMLLPYNQYFIIEEGLHTPLANLFFGKLTTFLIAIAISRYINLKKEADISYKNWGIIITIALISMYTIMLILSISSIPLLLRAICILGMIIINLAVVYLYSSVLGNMQDKFDKALYQKQLEYTQKEFDTLKHSTENTKILQHDINNHLSTIKGMIENNSLDQAAEYIDNLTTKYLSKSNKVNTGNIVIDSIVNPKIAKMDDLKINYKLNITVPEDLQINSISMTAVLGNALDNALEAVSKLEKEKRWLNLTIKYTKTKLIINLENPYEGEIIPNNANIPTSKTDKKNHGLGLKSITDTINKEKGLITRKTEDNIFKLKIII